MNAWVMLATAIVCEVAATLSLKGAIDRPALYVVVVLGYAAAMVLLTHRAMLTAIVREDAKEGERAATNLNDYLVDFARRVLAV